MMDRIDTYAAFAAVVDCAGFAAAARRLKRTPAYTTRAVAALEAELGVRLLHRNTRAVSLTEAGERYLPVVQRLLAGHAELRGVDGIGVGMSGTLRITAPAHFGRLHVVPLLAAFLDRHPVLRADLLLIDRVVSMVEEGIDVGIRLGELPDSSLRASRAGSLRLGVYASPAYLAAHGAPADWAEVTRRHRVVSSLAICPQPDRWRVEWDGRARQVAVQPRVVVNTTDAAAEAGAAGLGLVRLVSYQAEPLLRSGALVAVPLPDTRVIPIHVVQQGGASIPAAARRFAADAASSLRRRFPAMA